jgi:hypothetical protein
MDGDRGASLAKHYRVRFLAFQSESELEQMVAIRRVDIEDPVSLKHYAPGDIFLLWHQDRVHAVASIAGGVQAEHESDRHWIPLQFDHLAAEQPPYKLEESLILKLATAWGEAGETDCYRGAIEESHEVPIKMAIELLDRITDHFGRLKAIQNYHISECDFEFACPSTWSVLQATDLDYARFCPSCERLVYRCDSFEELQYHVDAGHCVAATGNVSLPKILGLVGHDYFERAARFSE